MKKTYINPKLKTVNLKMNYCLLAGSPGPDAGGSTDDPNDLLARPNDFDWDDEEEY